MWFRLIRGKSMGLRVRGGCKSIRLNKAAVRDHASASYRRVEATKYLKILSWVGI